MVVWCDNIRLVSLILLGWELHVLYYVYMPSFILHSNLNIYLSPLILITIPNLLIMLVQVSSIAIYEQPKEYVVGSLDYIYMYREMHIVSILT